MQCRMSQTRAAPGAPGLCDPERREVGGEPSSITAVPAGVSCSAWTSGTGALVGRLTAGSGDGVPGCGGPYTAGGGDDDRGGTTAGCGGADTGSSDEATAGGGADIISGFEIAAAGGTWTFGRSATRGWDDELAPCEIAADCCGGGTAARAHTKHFNCIHISLQRYVT